MTKVSWFANLMRRRVPQFTGMYIAAAWLVIELGDWITSRFNLPDYLTSYLFIGMLIMLPAVILFAYNHGAPGKDHGSKAEAAFITTNAAVTVAALWFLSPSISVEAATETIQLEDETGQLQKFEVVRQGHHKEVLNFFWENKSGDDELDWLEYGLPTMLAYDIDRVSPVITLISPFESTSLAAKLKAKNFPQLTDVPKGLAIEITRERRSSALILGSFKVDGDTKIVSASLIDAGSGDLLGSLTDSADDWLTAIDKVSAAILKFADVEPGDNYSDDPIAQHFTGSLDAIQHYVYGSIAISIDNDYPRGIEEYNTALEFDEAFAEAGASLSIAHYLNGTSDLAKHVSLTALRNSYRLSEKSQFILKANRYIFEGKYAQGERVLDIWTQVQPNSTLAWNNVAFLARVRGNEEGLNKALHAYDQLLQLNPNDYSVYLKKAEVEQQRRNFEGAASQLTRYIEHVPDSADAYFQIASVYLAQGDFDAALSALQDAAILSEDSLAAEVGIARLEARRGRYAEAKARLQTLSGQDLNERQQTTVFLARSEIAFILGEIESAIALSERASEAARSFMPPAIRIVSIDQLRASMLASAGRGAEAIAHLETMATQVQAPLSSYLNSTYATVYDKADDRESFRRMAQEQREKLAQLPALLQPFAMMNNAQVSVWDGDKDAAAALLDEASRQLDQSMIQVFNDSLGSTDARVWLARLYLQAGRNDTANEQLQSALRIFPGNPYSMMMYAQVLIADGEADRARRLLQEALQIWDGADKGYLLATEARKILATL